MKKFDMTPKVEVEIYSIYIHVINNVYVHVNDVMGEIPQKVPKYPFME